MPTYEYKCSACGEQFEKFQSIMAAPIKKCPACGKNKAQRLISAGAGIIFKGSGFYITDYRDAGYKESAKADSAQGTSTETKSDAKPSDTTAAVKPSDSGSTTSANAEPAKPAAKAEPKPAASKSAAKKSKKS